MTTYTSVRGCTNPALLTVHEALEALVIHKDHGCQIARHARKIRARVIDAPTIPVQATLRHPGISTVTYTK